jgi:hypothetical protein
MPKQSVSRTLLEFVINKTERDYDGGRRYRSLWNHFNSIQAAFSEDQSMPWDAQQLSAIMTSISHKHFPSTSQPANHLTLK